MPIKQQSGQQILNLLKQGYVRYKKEDDGNGLGSIEEVTGLSPTSLKEILKHPRLVNIRVKVPLYVLVDDFEAETEDDVLVDDFDEEENISAEIIAAPVHAVQPVAAPVQAITHILTAQEKQDSDEKEFEAIIAKAGLLEVDLLG